MKKQLCIAFGLALVASPALAGGHPPAATMFTMTPLVSDQALPYTLLRASKEHAAMMEPGIFHAHSVLSDPRPGE